MGFPDLGDPFGNTGRSSKCLPLLLSIPKEQVVVSNARTTMLYVEARPPM